MNNKLSAVMRILPITLGLLLSMHAMSEEVACRYEWPFGTTVLLLLYQLSGVSWQCYVVFMFDCYFFKLLFFYEMILSDRYY